MLTAVMSFLDMPIGPIAFPIPNIRFRAPLWIRLWRAVFPLRLRFWIYRAYKEYLDKFNPRRTSTYRLGLGLYLKFGPRTQSAEAHALWLVKQHTKVPIPTVLDYIVLTQASGRPYSFILMTEVPGQTLEEVQDTLSEDQLNDIGLQIREHIDAYRNVPNPYPNQICGASGGPMWTPQFDDMFRIPSCADATEFHAWMRKSQAMCLPPSMMAKFEPTFQDFNGPTFFLHGDLADRNIIIRDGKVSGLVDWSTSGWMPLYWEYFTALAADRHQTDAFNKMIKVALRDDYEDIKRMMLAIRTSRG
ncbi:kinase-like protein [Dacryopinax primogenitus]|uniref:Kinase-like protein n=1 Tax=Dacryopinax primogenitus (strain DJM 731) TaxID=1858805 RepID=M5G2I8_DACPD|nr:kinase-like protein [Dacryopinax primogenitus]EJU02430.1 kinase-like protein [Dacryopinax primogenitus]